MTLIYNLTYLINKRRALRRGQTDAERKLWSRLRKRQLRGLRFRRQFSVGLYILDFYCPEKRLAIEVDGGHHLDQKMYDDQRTQYLVSLNIRVLRFWNSEVLMNIDSVLERIEQELHL